MSEKVVFILDGEVCEAEKGQTILEAANAAGKYIPRLCWHAELIPFGGCRICTVLVNGRPRPSCIQPVADGITVENDSPRVNELRAELLEMLFVEGNHYCPVCEVSGSCELQALAYRLGITAPRYSYFYPKREVDASHPDILIDRDRCVLCGRCVRASRDLDGKNIFQFVGRGAGKKISVNAMEGLRATNASATDRAIDLCPVGALLLKKGAYERPFGKRPFDRKPIGSQIAQECEPTHR